MKTKVEKINKNQINTDIIEEAGKILKEGGLVAFPTETVYGLGADALNEEAAKKIYEAKGRPSDNPLIVHIADLEALDGITASIPPCTKKIAEAYWPGPLTMIFEKNDRVPYGTTGGLETVAVRMPDHDVARALIRAGGGYIAAPSANTSGRPSPTKASHVKEDLDGRIEMIIDGGDSQNRSGVYDFGYDRVSSDDSASGSSDKGNVRRADRRCERGQDFDLFRQ